MAERETAIADARTKLAGYPRPVVAQFETLLKAAQTAAIVHEEHNFWIDQRLFYEVRQIILEIGRRLTEDGVLEAADDVLYLWREDEWDGSPTDLRQKVHERRAELEHFSRIRPPATLGQRPAINANDPGPFLRAIAKVDGAAFKAEGAGPNGDRPQMLKGQAGSSGVVCGTARVIRSLAEAGKLQPGDVLVADSTEPQWTPLFATASAVVTNSGGVLSHCAVVAREYRIPAVVGTGKATTTFADGQLLEVDGDAGTVRVVVEARGREREPALAG